jgi:hypothetical protein
MGRGKLSRYVGTLLFASAITCMIGFWASRTHGSESWIYWAQGLKWTLIALAACAAYMAGVGLYHTALAALGLDGEPGLFSKGARSGPFSGPPVDARHAQVVPGAGLVPEAPPPDESGEPRH